jgi:hypothetical protein
MNTEQLWEIFADSGKIADYLAYAVEKESKYDNT